MNPCMKCGARCRFGYCDACYAKLAPWPDEVGLWDVPRPLNLWGMYTLLAWLPGSENFIAVDPAGVTGYLTPTGFHPSGPWLLEVATEKYWYEHLPEPFRASAAQATRLAAELQAVEEAA